MKLFEFLKERMETEAEKQKRTEKKKKKITRSSVAKDSPWRREEGKRAKGMAYAAGNYKNAGDWKSARIK